MTRPRVLLAAAMTGALVLSGCGSGSGSGSAGTKKTGTLHMAFIYASTTQNPFQEMALGAKAAAGADGKVTLNEAAPTGIDGPATVQLFQAATRNSPDGIALQDLSPDLFVRPLNQAADSGVPTVAVDATPPPGTKTSLYVGNSNTEVGRALGTEFVKHVPASAKGEVVLGNDIPGLKLLEQRLAGVSAVIKAQRPNLKVLGPYNAGSEPTANYNGWNAIVKAHPNALAYLGVGSQDGVSLPLIQKQTGRKFLAGSCDVDPAALRAVKDGSLFALSSPEHWLKGYIALQLLIDHQRTGKKLPAGWWNPGTLVVTKDNVDKIIARQKDAASRTAYFSPIAKAQLAHPARYLKPLAQVD
ncbi:MAG TPA: sugar ABC transporter substrate-binding protein [Streptosporangiaceae bacterium]|jgi:ribose transport system substrate-binding protein